VRGLPFVARVEPYHPWYRLSPELRRFVESDEDGEVRVRAVVHEWGLPAKSRVAAAAVARGARVAELWPSGHVVELWVDRGQLEAVAALDDVQWIDPWTPRETDMDLVREDAGVNLVENETGWCGQGVRAEVMDAGFQHDHPDFDGILLHNSTAVDSHGTSTYGIIFGNGDRDGDGSAQGTGHIPCAQGIAADYGSLGDRFAHTEELKQDPYFASFQSNSWGNARTRAYTSISQEMDDIIFRLDFTILQSQSNAGNQDSRPQAWAKNIISVGGVRHENTLDEADDSWTGGASIGPAADGRIKPDVHYWYDDIFTTTTGSGYTSGFGGTSAATPESAGVLGLMLQMWAENVWGNDPEGATVFEKQPHASTMKALLINNAKQYPFSGSGADLSRHKQGWGRPNAAIARDRAADSFIVDWDVPLEIGEVTQFSVEVPPFEDELKITLVYPDPPGTTSAALHRINDVDLRVTSPSGVTYHGNVGLVDGTESAPGGTKNDLDKVENVFVVAPEAGTWSVEVEAAEINQDGWLETGEDDVVFSLVVTGGTGSLCDAPVATFSATPDPARVGQEIAFTSDVTGGAGGPYEYRWDFDADGETDSTDANPTHVYTRPYDRNVKLRVRDAASCPESTDRIVTVTGPDLRFDDVVDRIEVSGNGNGTLDPGEVWDLRVVLRNDGNESALGTSAELRISDRSPGTAWVLAAHSSYPDVPAGGTATSNTWYRVQVGDDFTCGQEILLDVAAIRTGDPANRYPDEVASVALLVGGSGAPVQFWYDGFESANGWTSAGGGEWQRGAPLGLGGAAGVPGFESLPDPEAAFEGSSVIGNDLTGTGTFEGRYENGVAASYMYSPFIDATSAIDIRLSYHRWLNVFTGDVAFVEVSPDGSTWTRLDEETEGTVEQAWTEHVFDVSAIADSQPDLRFRFGIQTDGVGNNSGWNVDAFELTAVTRESCEPFARSQPGATGAFAVARNQDGTLALTWAADCGGASSYAVYRGDLGSGYGSLAPEPGFCDVAATSATLPAGDGLADFFLVVPNDGANEGSYGADSAGPRAPSGQACYPGGGTDACAP
jgi:PKD repeat protein